MFLGGKTECWGDGGGGGGGAKSNYIAKDVMGGDSILNMPLKGEKGGAGVNSCIYSCRSERIGCAAED